MAEALRHARLLHYLLIALSLAALPLLFHRNPLAETYAHARIELGVLSGFLGLVPPDKSSSERSTEIARMQQAQHLIATRVQEHVHDLLSRSLQMGMGGDLDGVEIGWEVPIAHQGQLLPDADLLQIQSHFAAIPIMVLQPDLGEFAWLLTSNMSSDELAEIRTLTVRLKTTALKQYIARTGFHSSDDGYPSEVELVYTTSDGEEKRIESTILGRIVRMPDLNQRKQFHASFPELERVFHFVEFQTPEQADITLLDREREARGGVLRSLALSQGTHFSLLLFVPLFMLFLLSHVRHVAALFEARSSASVSEFTWFPLFSDSNSKAFSVLTLVILPGAGALAWLARNYAESITVPPDDLVVSGAGFAVPAWIGLTILRELEDLRVAAGEAAEETPPQPVPADEP